MRLDDAFSLIQNGDLFFLLNGPLPHQRIIQARTGGYHHVGGLFWGDYGAGRQLWCWEELMNDGFKSRPLLPYLVECQRNGTTFDWYQLTDPRIDRTELTGLCQLELDRPYSRLDQFFWAFTQAGRWIREKLQLPFDMDESGKFCSEMYAGVLQHFGCEPPIDVPQNPAQIDPAMLSRFDCLKFMGALTP